LFAVIARQPSDGVAQVALAFLERALQLVLRSIALEII